MSSLPRHLLISETIKNTKICLKVKMSKALSYFERYCNRYSDQAPAISGRPFLSCTLPLFLCRDLDLTNDLENEP